MKPGTVDLSGARTAREAMTRVIGLRFDEASALCTSLSRAEPEELHQFRIACKRLRYALERCDAVAPALAASAAQVALVADALGKTHDCDNLLALLPASMPKTHAKLSGERRRAASRSARLWSDARVLVRESLRYYESATPCNGEAGSRA